MNRDKKNAIRIGLAGLLAIILLVVGTTLIGKKGLLNTGKTLYLLAEDVNGITEGTPVNIKGLEVGKVEEMSLEKDDVLIRMSFQKDVEIQKSAQFFSTSNHNLIGGRQISVVIIAERGPFYENGDTIKTGLLVESVYEKFDSTFFKDIEPTLKDLSRQLGKALLEYGEEE